jgi:hypothetical protein
MSYADVFDWALVGIQGVECSPKKKKKRRMKDLCGRRIRVMKDLMYAKKCRSW